MRLHAVLDFSYRKLILKLKARILNERKNAKHNIFYLRITVYSKCIFPRKNKGFVKHTQHQIISVHDLKSNLQSFQEPSDLKLSMYIEDVVGTIGHA